MDIGVEIINYCGDDIRVFSKERLLIELIRKKNKMPFDYYKEILRNYRKIIYELDFQLVEEYAEKLPKTNLDYENDTIGGALSDNKGYDFKIRR